MSKREPKSLFKRLTTLFRSGPVVKRKIRALDTGVAKPDAKSSGTLLFQKSLSPSYATITSNAYNLTERLMRYQDFQEMEYSLAIDTQIATPDGFKTIGELSDECSKDPNKTFIVYAYDHVKQQIVPALGKQARQTCVDHAWKITFDNGKTLTGSPEHRLMLRDGSYRRIEDLKPGDAMMPFYRKDLFAGAENGTKGYSWVYTMDDRFNGWTKEHQLIAEWVADRRLTEDEVVHHINFVKTDNRPENLKIMSKSDHDSYHAAINNNVKWAPENHEWIESFKTRHAAWMRDHAPTARRDVTFARILETAERVGFSMPAIAESLDVTWNLIFERLVANGFANFSQFVTAYASGQSQSLLPSNKPGLLSRDLSIDLIKSVIVENDTKRSLCIKLGCTVNVLDKFLERRALMTWSGLRTTLGYKDECIVSSQTKRIRSGGRPKGTNKSPLTFQQICDAYTPGLTLPRLAEKLTVNKNTVISRLAQSGYKKYTQFQQQYNNCKVVSVEYVGVIPLYDLTVDGYKNFATDSVISHNTPEIAAALDIYADETCLSGDTIVPLLDGSRPTAHELFQSGCENFWVYSYDISSNSIVPGLATRVVKTGTKRVFRINLDDGTSLRLTGNHRVLLSDGSYVEVCNLDIGDSLRSLYTKLSDRELGDHIHGYEQVLSTTGWQYTHRVVAESVQPGVRGVVHHMDFNKRNNEPGNLCFMSKQEHQELHARTNTERWKLTPGYATKMKTVFSSTAKKSHANPGFTDRLLAQRNATFASYDVATRKEKFSRSGIQNGMYGNGQTVSASKNGRWDSRFVRSVTREQILGWINAGKSAGDICAELPMRYEDLQYSMRVAGISKWSQKHVVDAPAIMAQFGVWRIQQPAGVNMQRSFLQACKFAGVTRNQAYYALNASGYQTWGDYVNKTNHRVVSIVEEQEEDVFDLEVSQWHNFAVTATPGSTSFVFVHNCAQDDKGRVLHVYSDNEKIREILEDLFYNTLNVEFNLRSWVRNLVKYGDFFLYNDVSPEYGVTNAFPIPVNEVEREENFDPDDPFAVRYRWVSLGNRKLENWEVTHFRLLGNDMFLPYGSSIIEPARRIWRQLILIEDAMLVYRVVRAPERRVFYIDVANIPPENVPMYVEEQKKNLRSNQVVDRTTGRVDLRYNPMSVDEDYFIPVRGGDTGTKIDTLTGGQNTAAVEDVAYIQKKLFAALKIPRAYLGYDEMLSSKATLAQEDIRFSRTINVIQKTIIAELNKLAIIHLYANGYDDDDLQNFTLHLSNPSTVAQQQKLELWRAKFEIAGSMPEGFGSRELVQTKIWGLSQEEIAHNNKQRVKERLLDLSLEGLQNEEPEGGGEDLFGDEMGGEPQTTEPAGGGGEEELPPPETAGEEPEEETEPDTELLTSGDEPGESFSLKGILDTSSMPVKVQKQLKHALYNRSRRRTHGASKTHLPDFQKMTSNDSRSMKDPFDNDWLKSVVSNPLGESQFVKPRAMSSDIASTLSRMSRRLHITRSNVISEGIDVQDEISGKINAVDDIIDVDVDDNDDDR